MGRRVSGVTDAWWDAVAHFARESVARTGIG